MQYPKFMRIPANL